MLIEKRDRRVAPAAQRRLAGEPKAKLGASLPRSEINCQLFPASRLILINAYLATDQKNNKKKQNQSNEQKAITPFISSQDILSGIGGTPILPGHLVLAFG